MSKFNPFAINQLRSLSRRDFIRKSGGCAALSSTAVLGQLLNLQMTSSVMAQFPFPGNWPKAARKEMTGA